MNAAGAHRVQRDNNHDRLRRVRQVSDGRGEFRNAAVDGRPQFGAAEIGLGASFLSDILIALRRSYFHLGLQNRYLPFCCGLRSTEASSAARLL